MSKSDIQIWLFVFLQTYGFLLWDSDGYIYWRGNKRIRNDLLRIDGKGNNKCTRRRIDFQEYFIKNQIWYFTIVEVTKCLSICKIMKHLDLQLMMQILWRIIKLKKKSVFYIFRLEPYGMLLLLTDTEMLQYEGSIVPLKLLLLVGLLHNDGNIVKMVFCQMYFSLIYFFFQPEISVSIWALWSVENNASEKQLLEWPICYSSPFIYPKLQTY